MPRAPRFSTVPVRELFAQMRYSSAASRRQQMDRAEQLAREIEPAAVYPADFVLFRITGYRSEGADPPVMLVGEALRADLAVLVQRVSRGLDLRPDHAGREALTLDAVRRELSISSRTLQRYRRQGLVCHYVLTDAGIRSLHCFRDALAAFRATAGERLQHAADFSRMGADERAQLLAAARRLREAQGLTLNEVARRLAPGVGRAPETVRSMLRRHDRRGQRPIFDERGPLDERELELILRAWHFGVPPSRLARRFGKATTTIHHAISRMRRRRLVELPLAWVELATFELPDCEAVILGAPAVRHGLSDRLGDDLLALADGVVPLAEPGDDDLEDALVAGYNLLKRRSAAAIGRLPGEPPAAALDAIETDLRWAALLKRRLVEHALVPALRAVEQSLHRRLRQEPAEDIQRVVHLALDVASATVETLDPARQRLERACSFAMDRALARAPSRPPGRAAARHEPGSIRLAGAHKRFCPWQTWLDPRSDLLQHLGVLDERSRTLICRRYGWDGDAPVTLAALAEESGLRLGTLAASLRAAERRLRVAARR